MSSREKRDGGKRGMFKQMLFAFMVGLGHRKNLVINPVTCMGKGVVGRKPRNLAVV